MRDMENFHLYIKRKKNSAFFKCQKMIEKKSETSRLIFFDNDNLIFNGVQFIFVRKSNFLIFTSSEEIKMKHNL